MVLSYFISFHLLSSFLYAQKDVKSKESSKLYGGVFYYNESYYLKSLFPHNLNDNISARVASYVYEGLFKFDPVTLKPKKLLVESYSVSKEGTIYTFKLKKNVLFHDDPCFVKGKGRELVANDIKFCFTLLCTQGNQNNGFPLMFKDILKGANKYYEASVDGRKPSFEIEGIKVIDKYTFQLILEKPNVLFIHNLAKPYGLIFSKEAYIKYSSNSQMRPVGTGPFVFSSLIEWKSVSLNKNLNYHGVDSVGNKLPYLNGVEISFITTRDDIVKEFKNGKLAFLSHVKSKEVPSLDSLLYAKVSFAQPATNYLIFNNQLEPFDNKYFRKAIAFALDRRKFFSVLNNESIPGVQGIVPSVLADYDVSELIGYNINLDSARFYLSLANFKSGIKVPKLNLIIAESESLNEIYADEIKRQLKENLSIDIGINILPMAQYVEDMQFGKKGIYKVGWLASYPSPEDFLCMFYGKKVPADQNVFSFPNMSRYKSEKFDQLYNKGLTSLNLKEANKYFFEAEKVLMDDCGVLVLEYLTDTIIYKKNLNNFHSNAFEYLDLTNVYFAK